MNGIGAARFLARGVLIGAVNMNLPYARLLGAGVRWLNFDRATEGWALATTGHVEPGQGSAGPQLLTPSGQVHDRLAPPAEGSARAFCTHPAAA